MNDGRIYPRKKRRALGLLAGSACVCIIVASTFMREPKTVSVGMSENEVTELLGPPMQVWHSKDTPTVVMWHGDVSLYGKPVKNTNKVLIYHSGIDESTFVFLDSEGRVRLVNSGGT